MSRPVTTSPVDRLAKARRHLLAEIPFFGTLSYRLTPVLDESVRTASTDGKTVRFNPEHIAGLSAPELAGLYLEEVGHCAFLHFARRGDRNLNIWNKACDQVLWQITLDLQKKTPLVKLPPGCRVNPDFEGLSAEQIYHILSQDPDDHKNYRSPGGFTDPPPPDPSAKSDPSDSSSTSDSNSTAQEDLAREWEQAVHAAAATAAMRGKGTLPAWIEAIVGDLKKPRVPWVDYVREFCHSFARSDYSFSRPNRRLLGTGFVLPSLYSVTLGDIIGAFDTSGSIYANSGLVTEILSELQGILDLCRPQSLRLISCDTEVKQDTSFLPGDDLRSFVPKGGGGTDFRPVFAAAEASPEPPACLIFLTDLEGVFPDRAPSFPVLWANYGDPTARAPFGQTIHVAA